MPALDRVRGDPASNGSSPQGQDVDSGFRRNDTDGTCRHQEWSLSIQNSRPGAAEHQDGTNSICVIGRVSPLASEISWYSQPADSCALEWQLSISS
jgi:hypothetical protein